MNEQYFKDALKGAVAERHGYRWDPVTRKLTREERENKLKRKMTAMIIHQMELQSAARGPQR